jgi:phage major head subunit gpT-like protein
LDAITKNFNKVFGDALQDAPTRMDLVTTVTSSGADETFPIGALLASIREWLGDRVIQDIAAYFKTIPNKKYEGTVGVGRDVIEDDRLGLYAPTIQTLGAAAAMYPYEQCLNQLDVNGWSTSHTGFDSVAFFSASHTWPAGYTTAQDNTTDETLDAAAVKTGITAMAGFKGPDGKTLNSRPTHFLCGTGLEFTAKALFVRSAQADADDHTLVGTIPEANIVVDSRITALRWFLLDNSKPIKPMVWQNRKSPVFVSQTDPSNSAAVFLNDKFMFGVDGRGAPSCLAWWLAYGSDGSE